MFGFVLPNFSIASLYLGGFNTTIVWVRQVENLIMKLLENCFNTTIVWVRPIIDIDFLDHIIGFNTTIVWVRLMRKHYQAPNKSVSIQRLFGFVQLRFIIAMGFLSFNTTIVWVRLYFRIVWLVGDFSFNTTIVWVRQKRFWRSRRSNIVSIQRLFGFVYLIEDIKRQASLFQYNDCLGSSNSLLYLLLR